MTTDLEPRTRGDGGMTLIEVLASLLIMGVVLAGLGAAGIAGLTSVRSEKDQLAATQVASKVVEGLRAAPWSTVAPVDPATTRSYAAAATTVSRVTYTPTVQVDWMDDACNGTDAGLPAAPPASPGPHAARDFLRFTVTLNWTDAKGRAKRAVTETYRAPTYAERRPALVDVLGASC